jgi:hypothetical protein
MMKTAAAMGNTKRNQGSESDEERKNNLSLSEM